MEHLRFQVSKPTRIRVPQSARPR